MLIFFNLALIFFSTLSFINKCDALVCRRCKQGHGEQYEGWHVHDELNKLGITDQKIFCSEKIQNDFGKEETCKEDEKFCLLGHLFMASLFKKLSPTFDNFGYSISFLFLLLETRK